MTTIWLVLGERGEYSDWTMWPVRAFTTEAAAETFAAQAQTWCRDVQAELQRRLAAIGPAPTVYRPATDDYYNRCKPVDLWYYQQKNPYDPDASSTPEATYSIAEVPMET